VREESFPFSLTFCHRQKPPGQFLAAPIALPPPSLDATLGLVLSMSPFAGASFYKSLQGDFSPTMAPISYFLPGILILSWLDAKTVFSPCPVLHVFDFWS